MRAPGRPGQPAALRRPQGEAPGSPDQGGQRLASRLHVPGDRRRPSPPPPGRPWSGSWCPPWAARRRALALAADGERTTFVATERLALAPANGAPGSLYEAVSREALPDSAETDLLRRTVLGQFDLAPDADAALAALKREPAGRHPQGRGRLAPGLAPGDGHRRGAPGQATLLQRVRQRRDAAGLLESSLAARAASRPLSETRERLRTDRNGAPPGEPAPWPSRCPGRGERRALSQQLARLEGDVRWGEGSPPAPAPSGPAWRSAWPR